MAKSKPILALFIYPSLKVLVKIIEPIFVHVGLFFVLYFPCCVFLCCILRVTLKALHSLWKILLLFVWKIFCQSSKKKVFLWVGQLGLIHYLAIFLCLFWNYLSVRMFNFLLIFLPILLISGISVVLGWFRLLALLLNMIFSSLHYNSVAMS